MSEATPDLLTGNVITVPKLLRAISNGRDAQLNGHHIVLRAAADLIDQNAAIMRELEDVPGKDALEKVQRLKAWYQDLYAANVAEYKKQ